MAGVVGKAGSFATVDKVNDSIGQAFKDVNALYDASAANRKKEADVKKAAEQKRDADNLTDLEKIKGETSGKKGADAIIISSVSKLSNKFSDNYRALNSGQMSQTEFNIQKNNILRQVDYLNQGSKRTAEKATIYEKDMMDGKYAPEFHQDILNYGNAINDGNTYEEVDENGNLDLILFRDNENGEREILEKNNISVFGTEAFSGVLNFDFDKDLTEFKANNPMAVTESFQGNSIVGETKITPQIKSAIESQVNSHLTDSNKLSIAYQQATGKAERNITDPAKIKIAKEALVKKYEESYNPKKEVKEALGRASNALAVKKNNQDQQEKKIQKTISDYTEVIDEKTNIKLTTKNKKQISVPEEKVKFNNLGGSKSGRNLGYVTSFVLQNNGEIAVVGKSLVDKGRRFKVGNKKVDFMEALDALNSSSLSTTEKTVLKAELDSYNIAANYSDVVVRPNGSELGNLVAQAGYGSDDELKAELRELNPESSKQGKWSNK